MSLLTSETWLGQVMTVDDSEADEDGNAKIKSGWL